MGQANFFVVVLATLNRVPLMMPLLSLPGPQPSNPEPVYAPAPPESSQTEPSQSVEQSSEPRQLSGSFEDALYTTAGTCPHEALWEILDAPHAEVVDPPAQSADEYEAKGLLGADGTLALSYTAIENAGSMCIDEVSPEEQIVLGGMFFWETPDGQCMLPPLNDVGNPCCMLHMWQANVDGMYYDYCTMKMSIKSDGLYYFTTVVPGNEVPMGWGTDAAPHINYDVVCANCAANDAFSGGTYAWQGKVYPEGLCTDETACGIPGDVHQVQEHDKWSLNGKAVYKYDFVFPRLT